MIRTWSFSDEARAKISATHKGKPKSSAHREAIAAALRGKPKTEDISYHVIHARMGHASDHLCECGARALDWAYQYTAVVELRSPEGWPYSTDPADYKPMCRRCHKRLDGTRHE